MRAIWITWGTYMEGGLIPELSGGREKLDWLSLVFAL